MSMCISLENVLFHYCDHFCSIRGPRCFSNSCLHLQHTYLSPFYTMTSGRNMEKVCETNALINE